MHCICCDKMLSDYESTRKNVITGNYVDMCNKCFFASDLPELVAVEERDDLATIDEVDEEDGHED